MNIRILSIETHQQQERVKFESTVGVGFGVWIGKLPTQGESIDVEVEIDDDLKWGRNITMTNESASTITSENSQFRFVAEVVTYEGNGCLSVRLGESVILLNVEDVPGNVKGWVECRAESVKLYPTNT